MIGKYNIECCVGIRHVECLEILFKYLCNEIDYIDKINLLIANNFVLSYINNILPSIIKHKSVIRPFSCIDSCDIVRSKYKTKDTVYIYIDDDICYLSPNFISRLVNWHIECNNIISYPSIANTGTTTFIWQVMGILPLFKKNDVIQDSDYKWIDCAKIDAKDSVVIHNKFIYSVINEIDLSFYRYYLYDKYEMYKQIYIWFGGDECNQPSDILFDNCTNKFCINGEVFASHFAFRTHRQALNNSGIINKYKDILGK